MIINKTSLNPAPQFLAELGAQNPFSYRPSTAQQVIASDLDMQTTLADLDSVENAPNVDKSVWDRFVAYRRLKIAFENSLRMKTLTLGEMTLYLQRRQEEDEQKKREIEECSRATLL